MIKQRLDQLLVDRGLAPSPERARALIMAGRVRGRDRVYTKPGRTVASDLPLDVVPDREFVSRGGKKLLAALQAWPVPVTDRVCLDVGAATGGFTDCLLRHGARRVFAVDVGYGQLHLSIRNDPRVVVMERTNARALPPLDPAPSLVTIDASFISLRTLLPSIADVCEPRADLMALVKPQFEAPRDAVGKGGVVRHADQRASSVAAVALWAARRGWRIGGVLRSPLTGPAGNHEYFLWLRTPASKRQSRA